MNDTTNETKSASTISPEEKVDISTPPKKSLEEYLEEFNPDGTRMQSF